MVLPSRQRSQRSSFCQTAVFCFLFVTGIFSLRLLLEPSEEVLLLSSLPEAEHETTTSLSKRKLHPKQLTCGQVLQMSQEGTIEDPNEGRIFARQSALNPHFWFTLHEESFDSVRWPMMEQGIYYEHKLTQAIAQVFQSQQENPQTFIDVGSNIGWFSLVAASYGANVIALEPNLVNLLRLCQSVCLNGWDEDDCPEWLGPVPTRTRGPPHPRVTIFPVGVSNQDGQAQLRLGIYNTSTQTYNNPKGSNPGRGQILTSSQEHDGFHSHTDISLVQLDTLAMDLGWSNIAALKVDVEGAEYNVLKGARQLLQRIENVFMEGNVKTQQQQDDFRNSLQLLQSAGLNLHRFGGSLGPGRSDLPTHNFTENLLHLCRGGTGRRRTQCNLWWKRQP